MKPQERLKNARKSLKLTQAQLAESIGLKAANVRDLESGKVKFSTLHALAIENVHQVDSSWLLTGVGEMFLKKKITEPEAREEFVRASVEWAENGNASVDKEPVDMKLLEEVIRGAESYLEDKDLELDPEPKAELIVLLYDQFISDNGQYDSGTLERFMRLGTR